MNKIYTTCALLSVFMFFSCSKKRVCECKTTWVEYTQYGPVEREETMAYTVKGTKKDAKTECDVIHTNQKVVDGFYTTCSLKD